MIFTTTYWREPHYSKELTKDIKACVGNIRLIIIAIFLVIISSALFCCGWIFYTLQVGKQGFSIFNTKVAGCCYILVTIIILGGAAVLIYEGCAFTIRIKRLDYNICTCTLLKYTYHKVNDNYKYNIKIAVHKNGDVYTVDLPCIKPCKDVKENDIITIVYFNNMGEDEVIILQNVYHEYESY